MRNLHFWFAAGMGALIIAFAYAVLRIALQESLWLDELHTSWTVSGPWHEIASRAAAGNQTPLYFWLVGLVSQTPGQPPEWILRLPSVVAWLLAIVLVVWQVRGKLARQGAQSWLFPLCIASWIVLDRLQWFYATEARPYALVQLISLAGWRCIQAIVLTENRPHRTWTLIVVWCFLSLTNIYLHLTAALPVLFQWLVAVGLVLQRRRNRRFLESAVRVTAPNRKLSFLLVWLAAAIAVGFGLLPIMQLAFPVWLRRTQWATFAGDVSLIKAAWMFPFIPVLLCVLIGCVVDRLLRGTANRSAITTEERCLWWSAMLGPWLTGWALAATGVAPMFHPRFVIASAMPLFVVGAIELLRCRHWASRWVTGLAIAIAIVYSQGSASVWRSGYLVGNLRGEDWRGATKWISQRFEPGEQLLCSSGLIEANSSAAEPLRLPLQADFAEYLSFPVLGIYRVADSSGQFIPVTPLVGDHRQWAAQVSEHLAQKSAWTQRLWLIYRGKPGRLKSKLTEFEADLRSKHLSFDATEPKQFGGLYVVELKPWKGTNRPP